MYHNTCLLIFLLFFTIVNCLFAGNFDDYKNQYPLLFETPFNEREDLIELSTLELFKPKPKGGCTGGIYQKSNQIYYVKQSNPFTELLGAKLMNLIIGTERTPLIKIVTDQVNYVASLELPSFQTLKFYNEKYSTDCKNTLGEVDLTIAMDLLGIVDRHNQNIGYIFLPHLPPIAARIDFDTSFSFDQIRPSHNTQYNPNSNHLSFELLYYSIKKYPKKQIINSIKKITQTSDEQIFLTIISSYLTLSQIEELELEPFLSLANRLIERKKLFREAIENRHSSIYKAIQRQYFKMKYKTFNKFFLELFPIHLITIKNQLKTIMRNIFFKKNDDQSELSSQLIVFDSPTFSEFPGVVKSKILACSCPISS